MLESPAGVVRTLTGDNFIMRDIDHPIDLTISSLMPSALAI